MKNDKKKAFLYKWFMSPLQFPNYKQRWDGDYSLNSCVSLLLLQQCCPFLSIILFNDKDRVRHPTGMGTLGFGINSKLENKIKTFHIYKYGLIQGRVVAMRVKKPSLQQNFTLYVHKYFLLLCLPDVNPIIKNGLSLERYSSPIGQASWMH